MGIDTDGGMIMGSHINDITIPEDCDGCAGGWAYENDLTVMSEYYDCDEDAMWVGFEVKNIKATDLDTDWLIGLKDLAIKFKELTGADASLIGMQNVS